MLPVGDMRHDKRFEIGKDLFNRLGLLRRGRRQARHDLARARLRAHRPVTE